MILWKSEAEKIQWWCRFASSSSGEISMLLVSVLFTEHLPLFSGAMLSATNNSMAGGKLQLRDEKRFEQPQLASSQAIGVIGFPFEFPFEESDFSLLPICSCEVWAVKLQWTEIATRTAGQNSNGEKADKASCFEQLYVTKVFLWN
jgi:hypothetical protein